MAHAKKMTPAELKTRLGRVLDDVADGDQVTVIQDGRPVALIVSPAFAARLGAWEDAMDAAAARAALDEHEAGGTAPRPWSEIKRELGL